MLPKQILFLLILCSFVSCVEESETLLTPPEKLVNILVDIHFVEGAMLSVRPAEKDSMRDYYYNQIFEIHGIEEEDFDQDMDILKSNPDMMEKVYDKVIENLGEMDEKAKKEDVKPKK